MARQGELFGSDNCPLRRTDRQSFPGLLRQYRRFSSRHEQKAIAAILGALDDKIELNLCMSATLEASAREIFRSWFVDFDPVRANE